MSNELTATILMDEEGALTIVKDRLDQGVAPEAVLDDARSAMTTLGEKFACEIGGSPVDQEVCTRTGADGWGREAAAAALAMAAEWTGGPA